MKRVLLIAGIIGLSLVLGGCTGPGVSIESGEIGKVTDDDEVRGEGTFNLEHKMIGVNDKLVKAQAGLTTHFIDGKYLISKSDLRLGLKLAIQVKVRSDEQSQLQVLGLTASSSTGHMSLISAQTIFDVYIMKGLRSNVRAALAPYTVEQIMLKLNEVETEISNAIIKLANGTPVEVYSVTFDGIAWPETIMLAKEDATKIKAEKKNRMLQLSADLEVKAAERQLQILDARLAVEADAIVAPSMGPKMAAWMMLEAIQNCSNKEHCNIDIHPAMMPQNAFNFANDTINYSEYLVPDAEIEKIESDIKQQLKK